MRFLTWSGVMRIIRRRSWPEFGLRAVPRPKLRVKVRSKLRPRPKQGQVLGQGAAWVRYGMEWGSHRQTSGFAAQARTGRGAGGGVGGGGSSHTP